MLHVYLPAETYFVNILVLKFILEIINYDNRAMSNEEV